MWRYNGSCARHWGMTHERQPPLPLTGDRPSMPESCGTLVTQPERGVLQRWRWEQGVLPIRPEQPGASPMQEGFSYTYPSCRTNRLYGVAPYAAHLVGWHSRGA